MPRYGEPWRYCDRCGFPYGMSQLVKQKGLWVCTVLPCRDDLTRERALQNLADRVGNKHEGEDQFALFPGDGEVV